MHGSARSETRTWYIQGLSLRKRQPMVDRLIEDFCRSAYSGHPQSLMYRCRDTYSDSANHIGPLSNTTASVSFSRCSWRKHCANCVAFLQLWEAAFMAEKICDVPLTQARILLNDFGRPQTGAFDLIQLQHNGW